MRGQPTSPTERRTRRLLADLSRALFGALAESSEVNRELARLEQAGLTLHLRVDCAPSAGARAGEPAAPGVTFRIDADDLAFLRSVGIDPTRRLRRPRPR